MYEKHADDQEERSQLLEAKDVSLELSKHTRISSPSRLSRLRLPLGIAIMLVVLLISILSLNRIMPNNTICYEKRYCKFH